MVVCCRRCSSGEQVYAVTKPPGALNRAFDAARFGFARTLDLRTSMPTGEEAVRRAEPWLRERQIAKAGDVLVITGRGNGSPGGVGIVRESVQRLFTALKRKGVISAVTEHTPGSFVVTLASVRALFEVAPRSRERSRERGRERGRGPRSTAPADPTQLAALDAPTRGALRRLAEFSLDTLGAPRTEAFVRDEMLRQFAVLSAAMSPDEIDRDQRLQFLIAAAQQAYENYD